MPFLIETHAHASEVSPCSHLPGASLAQEIKSRGYDALIVTDHYTPEWFAGSQSGPRFQKRLREFFAGYRAAREEGKGLDLIVLPALELRVAAGPEDFLVYGLEPEELEVLGCLAFLSAGEARRRVKDAGGLFLQAHPFRGARCMPAELLDGVETLNGNPNHDSRNDRALRFAEENGLLQSAGSDTHSASGAGIAAMRMDERPSVKGFARAIREGRAECLALGGKA
ncbi:MAG: PHP domain-containing protein [Christensenellaceae bacterium]|jgi:predicted metal-dependent phosphoesterase TrpH|nr:PHP domain-containing protein [Christensenellaceae bacterium]